MVEAVARSLRQEVASTGVTVSVVRPGGVNTPGYSHATGHVGQNTLTGLGCWVPGDVTQCLQPSQVASSVVNIITNMESQDIQEVNILPPPTLSP